MKKETTQQLKGIAILLMLWLHLFSEMDIINAHVYWFLPPILMESPSVTS